MTEEALSADLGRRPHSDTQDPGKALLDGTSHPARAIVAGTNRYDVRQESDGRVRVWLEDSSGQTTWIRLSPADAIKLGDAMGQVGRECEPSRWARITRWADEHPLKLWFGFWAVLVPVAAVIAVMFR